MPTNEQISRRAWLKNLMRSLAAASLVPRSTSATEGKASKSAVHYQDSPKGMQMCGRCKYFVSGTMDNGRMDDGTMGRGMMGHGMMTGECQVV